MSHAAIASLPFPVIDNSLAPGGIPIARLAARVGSTPFYVYDRAVLSQRMAALRAAVPARVRIHYSLKANPMPALVQHMAGLADGFDVSSAGELKIALDSTMPAGKISMTGPGKSEADLSRAVAAGVLIHLESARELERVARIGDRLGCMPRVALRVNPDFELKSSGMRMGGGAKPFGIDADQAPEVLRRIGAWGLDFHGLHIYSGSQCLRADAIVEAQAQAIALATRLAEHAPQPIRLLNIGGGFGVPYFPGESPLDLAPIGVSLARAVMDLQQSMPEATLALELGRYLVSEAGVYVSRVIDRKVSRGQVFLVADGGLHHHLAASGNLGQVIRKNYPVLIGNRVRSPHNETVSVTGPLCTPLDVLADRVTLPAADVGDFVVVLQSGAYGLSASPAAFLGHPTAEEVMV